MDCSVLDEHYNIAYNGGKLKQVCSLRRLSKTCEKTPENPVYLDCELVYVNAVTEGTFGMSLISLSAPSSPSSSEQLDEHARDIAMFAYRLWKKAQK